MSYNGNGVFQLIYDWNADKANGIKIRSDRMMNQEQDIADGLSTCITKDGQTTVTNDIPLNNNKITGLGDAQNSDDAVNFGQIQANSGVYYTTAGTIDAYTINPSPSPDLPYTGGLRFYIKIHATSISTTPTLTAAAGSAGIIANGDLSTLNPGDLVAGGVYLVSWESTAGKWLLPNRGASVPFGTDGGFYNTSFAATVTNARYTVYPPTAGMYVGLPNSSVAAGKFQMFVYVGTYPLYLYGTINGVAGTIPFTQQQTFFVSCTTVAGWV